MSNPKWLVFELVICDIQVQIRLLAFFIFDWQWIYDQRWFSMDVCKEWPSETVELWWVHTSEVYDWFWVLFKLENHYFFILTYSYYSEYLFVVLLELKRFNNLDWSTDFKLWIRKTFAFFNLDTRKHYFLFILLSFAK